MNLYEINYEIESIMAMADEDGMLPDEALDRLAELGLAAEIKAENLGLLIKNLTAEAEAIKAEADSLTKRRKAVENRIDGIKAYLTDYLKSTGQKFSTPRVVLTLRPSEAVQIIDESAVPDKYLVPQEPKISKTAIKDDLKAGVDVPGAVLEIRQNLQVK